jgi:acetolactate synthase I/II/III large subunit
MARPKKWDDIHRNKPGSESGLRPRITPSSMADALTKALADLGVELAFGVGGGGIAIVAESLARELTVIHCRHETGAAFAATEASLATRRPTVVFATTGPGVMNAQVGLAAARWEGAHVILVSASTSPAERGRWAFQETSALTRPSTGTMSQGSLYHFAYELNDPRELEMVARRLAIGLARPGGFAAHVAVPIAMQAAPCAPAAVGGVVVAPAGPDPRAVEAVSLLTRERFAIWAGFGARHAATEIFELVERTGAPVLCSPRAKGTFPEDDPRFLGVSGFAGGVDLVERLAHYKPRRLLVLGSRLGEFTSFWDPRLVPEGGLVQVDVDLDAIGTAYPKAPVLAVHSEVSTFLGAVLASLPEARAPRSAPSLRPAPPIATYGAGRIRPEVLLGEIQHRVVEGSPAIVLTEAGNAFAWGNRLLRFSTPNRYRTSMGFGSMGHAATGVVGAALARGEKAIALVGDGAMLMMNEVSTAVRYGARAVWIVLNDGRYGMIEAGMRAQGLEPVETTIPPTDFAALAASVGAASLRVTAERDLPAALEVAMTCEGPFVLDVVIEPNVVAPFLTRVESLMRQTERE